MTGSLPTFWMYVLSDSNILDILKAIYETLTDTTQQERETESLKKYKQMVIQIITNSHVLIQQSADSVSPGALVQCRGATRRYSDVAPTLHWHQVDAGIAPSGQTGSFFQACKHAWSWSSAHKAEPPTSACCVVFLISPPDQVGFKESCPYHQAPLPLLLVRWVPLVENHCARL